MKNDINEDPILSLTIWPHRSCDKKTFIPIFIGFILPILEILNWSLRFNSGFFEKHFFFTL